jgi:hypothetical protein
MLLLQCNRCHSQSDFSAQVRHASRLQQHRVLKSVYSGVLGQCSSKRYTSSSAYYGGYQPNKSHEIDVVCVLMRSSLYCVHSPVSCECFRQRHSASVAYIIMIQPVYILSALDKLHAYSSTHCSICTLVLCASASASATAAASHMPFPRRLDISPYVSERLLHMHAPPHQRMQRRVWRKLARQRSHCIPTDPLAPYTARHTPIHVCPTYSRTCPAHALQHTCGLPYVKYALAHELS